MASMSDRPEPDTASPPEREIALRNGTRVRVRVARPDDRDRIVAAFNELEPDSVYTRFFSMRKELTAAELDRLTSTDFTTFVGLLAVVGQGAGETVIGGATYVALPSANDTRAAEVAFTIEEDYQGQGLAGQLFAMLASVARQHGIQRFEAEVLSGNAPMLKVFERSGLPLTKRRDGGVTHIVMDLVPTGPEPKAAA
jgi:RimJ/RimL family protein N-acetyltransferase